MPEHLLNGFQIGTVFQKMCCKGMAQHMRCNVFFYLCPNQTLPSMTLNVYEQYFAAQAEYNGVPRHAALVMLIADSEAGQIRYEAAVTFFPHNDEEDYAVSYDAFFEQELYRAPGRRSKKREAALLDQLPAEIDALASAHDARVLWDRPLREARRG